MFEALLLEDKQPPKRIRVVGFVVGGLSILSLFVTIDDGPVRKIRIIAASQGDDEDLMSLVLTRDEEEAALRDAFASDELTPTKDLKPQPLPEEDE